MLATPVVAVQFAFTYAAGIASITAFTAAGVAAKPLATPEVEDVESESLT